MVAGLFYVSGSLVYFSKLKTIDPNPITWLMFSHGWVGVLATGLLQGSRRRSRRLMSR